MEIVLGSLLVLIGVVYGLYSRAGSGIEERPMADRLPESDVTERFDTWRRGTR
jgi:hypothetical protein